jgi:hypothetical protein
MMVFRWVSVVVVIMMRGGVMRSGMKVGMGVLCGKRGVLGLLFPRKRVLQLSLRALDSHTQTAPRSTLVGYARLDVINAVTDEESYVSFEERNVGVRVAIVIKECVGVDRRKVLHARLFIRVS